jgi:diaminopimelate epimerase
MAKTRFYKYEGLGNDFILLPKTPCLTNDQIRQLCDRHRGIGADGLIFVFLFEDHWTMRVYNADGGIAEMCGNGLRCAAQWLFDQGYIAGSIQTDAGIKTCVQESGLWSINMGIAEITGNRVSMGNPHLVLQGPVELEKIDSSVNTEFVQINNLHNIDIRVFERGVGETLACGTGACASVAMLVSQGQLPENQEITVHLKGGKLYITARYTDQGLQIQMKGPAHYVFEGEVFVE